ncbi:MAG: hypothetical protein OEZ58_21130 [Gammaproteobacteria bacterium]|nr:hypothetical protein [Gammaproteobacteria bacterium]MDH5731496.1 hypothetical protein [Gammaproteobacteria bacterium]
MERIEATHLVFKTKSFGNDPIRLGLMASATTDLEKKYIEDFVTQSTVLHAYPAYRRFIPGKWDLLRRFLFFVGVGKVIYFDDDVNVKGPSFSAGAGLDLAKGIVFNIGYHVQQSKITESLSFDSKGRPFFGVTLNREFWNIVKDY